TGTFVAHRYRLANALFNGTHAFSRDLGTDDWAVGATGLLGRCHVGYAEHHSQVRRADRRGFDADDHPIFAWLRDLDRAPGQFQFVVFANGRTQRENTVGPFLLLRNLEDWCLAARDYRTRGGANPRRPRHPRGWAVWS